MLAVVVKSFRAIMHIKHMYCSVSVYSLYLVLGTSLVLIVQLVLTVVVKSLGTIVHVLCPWRSVRDAGNTHNVGCLVSLVFYPEYHF